MTPPAKPTAHAPKTGDVRWRTYLGASVPGGAPGPRNITSTYASGWQHDRAGAILAAAHFAVAVDARQPRPLWRKALEYATPKPRAKAARKRLAKAAAEWDRRRREDAKSRADVPSDTDEHRLPPSIWRPPVRVVGYSGLAVRNGTYDVVLWSRTSGKTTWRSRSTAVRWSHGDWRLRLPVDRRWTRSEPIPDIRPISVVLS